MHSSSSNPFGDESPSQQSKDDDESSNPFGRSPSMDGCPPPQPPPPPPRLANPFAADVDVDDDDLAIPSRPSDLIPKAVALVKEKRDNAAALFPPKETPKQQVKQDADVELPSTIYYKNTLSERWLAIAIVAHIVQFSILLSIARPIMSDGSFGGVLFLVIAVVFLLIGARLATAKKPRVHLRFKEVLTPEDEADNVRPIAVHMLGLAAVLEGIAYAIFTAATAGSASALPQVGFYSHSTVVQTLQFASITFLTFHRSIRPSNRCDPLRTMLELEVVSVCWDALDGSTIFMLLETPHLSSTVQVALRLLLAFWYLSVGARTAFMYAVHLPPTSPVYQLLITRPLELAKTPVVDRTLQSLRQRSIVTLVMSAAELYAMSLRIYLWTRGQLDTLQIEMTVKNIMFLFQIYTASDMYNLTNRRDWNSRDLGFGLQYPSRQFQLRFFRVLFVVFYIVQGCLLSVICSEVTQESYRWIANFAFDIVLAVLFFYYCEHCHRKMSVEPRHWFLPQHSFVVYPSKLAVFFAGVMSANLFVARVPVLYSSALDMAPEGSGELWTYSHALLVVMLSVVTIGSGAMYWYLSHLLFNKEFTACPGDYNAIHDPTISMVAVSTQIEGALDVLSCVTLMQLATLSLPAGVNGAVQFFCLFELFNAVQSFALQVLLAGGQDDTPLDLVKWKAWLRCFRGLIDFGCFILRLVLWVKYNALSSVFLIKNLYNLLHTYAQIERYYGVQKYPKYTLFTESVPAAEWYGLNREEWREATRSTVIQQAQAGRMV